MRAMTMIAAVVVAIAAQACASPVEPQPFQHEGATEQAASKTTMCGKFAGAHGYEGVGCASGQVVGGSCTFSAGTNHGSHLDTDAIGRTVWACEADLAGAVAGNVEICSTVECQ